MDLLHLVDRLEELIDEAQKMPLGNRVIIDRRRLLDLIDQMRISIPQEVREAGELVSNRGSIIRDAEEESGIIIGRAEEKAAGLVEEHAITEAAKAHGQEISDEAERRLTQRVEQANDDIQIRIEESRDLARQQMQAADSYALELLQRLDRQLQAFVGSVQSGIHQVEPERELPPAPYPGEFDPGPPAPGNFRSEAALDSLPDDDRDTEGLTLTRHELPDMDIPAVTVPEPAPAPVVMAEPEPLLERATSKFVDVPVPVEEPPASTSRFGNSIWGRSANPEPEPNPEVPASVADHSDSNAPRSGFASSVWGRSTREATSPPTPEAVAAPIEKIEDLDEITDNFDSSVGDAKDDASEESAPTDPEPASGGGPFSSLFGRPPAADPPPPSPVANAGAPDTGATTISSTNLPGDSGLLPGVEPGPPATPSVPRFGFFGRRDQSIADVDTDLAATVETSETNGNDSAQSATSDESSAPAGSGASLGSDPAPGPNGELEDLLALARETADSVPTADSEDRVEQADSDQPTVVIDDFDNPPLDDDPIHGEGAVESDRDDPRPSPPGVY